MQQVLGDLAFCSGLLRGAGDDGTVIYAVDWAAGRLGLSARTVSVVLRQLRALDIITLVKTLPPLDPKTGPQSGARVYALVAPTDAAPVERRDG